MKPLLLSLALTFGTDAATTHVGLASGRAYERVLPTQNPWVVDGLVAGEYAAASWALVKLHRTKPRLAKWLGYSIVGSRAAVGVHNMTQLR